MAKLHTISCDPVCGFSVTSHHDKETIRMAMAHVADAHPDMKATTADVKKMIKSM